MNRLQPGVFVSGSYGDLIDTTTPGNYINSTNDDNAKKTSRKRKRLNGVIREAVGERRWIVDFEDGSVKNCPSSRLKFVSSHAPAGASTILFTESISTIDNVAVSEAIASRAFVPQNERNELMMNVFNDAVADAESEQQLNDVVTNYTIETVDEFEREHNINETVDAYEIRGSGLGVPFDDDNDDDIMLEELPNINEQLYIDQVVDEDIVESDEQMDDAQMDVVEDLDEHRRKWNEYLEEKEKLISEEWSIKKGRVTWKTCRDSMPNNPISEYKTMGVREVQWTKFKNLSDKLKQKVNATDDASSNLFSSPTNVKVDDKLPTPFLDLFLLLWPGDWQQQVQQCNFLIKKEQVRARKNGVSVKKIKEISQNEFLVFIGIIIIAGAAQTGGKNLYDTAMNRFKNGLQKVLPPINMSQFMSKTRFDEIRSKIDFAFEDRSKSEKSNMNTFDPWYKISKFVDDFNINRAKMIASSVKKVLDESMSAWRPRKSKLGRLPNISYILRKPENLGTEFKTLCCSETGIMLHLEIQRGKHEMPKRAEGYIRLGATTSCVTRCVKATENAGQKTPEHRRNLFYGDSWFSSVKTLDAVLDLGHEYVGPVKTCHKEFPKEELEKQLNNWPGGSYLVMEGLSPKCKPILAIGYKYNSRKVLCFVATKDAGSTLLGEPYRAKFLDDHGNIRSREVDRPAVISDYFISSNAVDKHNHARQAELKLEKHWLTMNPWFRLITTILGITVTDCWKAYKYKMDSTISVCDFSEQLAFELLHNNFSNQAISFSEQLSPMETRSRKGNNDSPASKPREVECEAQQELKFSPLTTDRSLNLPKAAKMEILWCEFIKMHTPVASKTYDKEGKRTRHKCYICKKYKTMWQCKQCGKYICEDDQGGSNRMCYRKHIIQKHPKAGLVL